MDNLKLYLAVHNTLETERLKLRPVDLGDVDDMYEYASDNDNTYFVFEPHRTLDDTRFSIATYFMADPLGKFGIELKSSQKLIGTADLRVDMKKSKGEIGYALNKKYFNQGYATEAATDLLKLAFETLQLEKVVATCDERNKASESVMKKIGMQFEGRSRHHELWKNGEWINMLYYAILKDEYFSQK